MEAKENFERYINCIKQYFTEGYKYYTNEEKIEFYIFFQSALPVDYEDDKFTVKLMLYIDDYCENMDCGLAEVQEDYFDEWDAHFIKILKEHGII